MVSARAVDGARPWGSYAYTLSLVTHVPPCRPTAQREASCKFTVGSHVPFSFAFRNTADSLAEVCDATRKLVREASSIVRSACTCTAIAITPTDALGCALRVEVLRRSHGCPREAWNRAARSFGFSLGLRYTCWRLIDFRMWYGTHSQRRPQCVAVVWVEDALAECSWRQEACFDLQCQSRSCAAITVESELC